MFWVVYYSMLLAKMNI